MSFSGTQRALDLSLHSKISKLLMQQLSNKIVGQEKALQVLLDIFEAHQAGFTESNKPVGNALFLGGTGTGKTWTCEILAEALFGNKRACLRIDCGEYQHSHEIAKLVGSPAGYLGHRETAAVLNQKRLNEYHTDSMQLSIVLLDEVEKASDALWNILLGILDNATLTLGTNEVVDFSKTIIVMTSNLGAREMANRGIGFAELSEEKDNKRLEQIAISAAKAKFSPEFMNRIQNIVMFKALTQEQIEKILEIQLMELDHRIFVASSPLVSLTEQKTKICPRFSFTVSPKAKKTLLSEGFDPCYGARHLKRAVEQRIQIPLSRLINSGQITAGSTVVVDDTGAPEFDFWSHPTEVPNKK
jgi:ATP-dependent Clp protease ATP-binding subunit ClpA